ncbi:hypothetical protein DPMN_059306 [Dreissena polymorpha]|uniref:Uncharacterized protein n=1 Tax=Dreissena polymorpha TaxID=45954 RepID=A0A9D4HEW8_DREPO|nr:hypothetical protein DPMN_059306 [Dreissena polymorpha]
MPEHNKRIIKCMYNQRDTTTTNPNTHDYCFYCSYYYYYYNFYYCYCWWCCNYYYSYY